VGYWSLTLKLSRWQKSELFAIGWSGLLCVDFKQAPQLKFNVCKNGTAHDFPAGHQ
jgi:hypothetical protein